MLAKQYSKPYRAIQEAQDKKKQYNNTLIGVSVHLPDYKLLLLLLLNVFDVAPCVDHVEPVTKMAFH